MSLFKQEEVIKVSGETQPQCFQEKCHKSQSQYSTPLKIPRNKGRHVLYCRFFFFHDQLNSSNLKPLSEENSQLFSSKKKT